LKAMILAAGLGVRLRPLTLLRAKPALPVLNRPLLHWTLERLAAAGVEDVIVNLHHLPQTVVAAVGDGSAFGVRVTYSRERTILGTGGGPRRVRRLLGDGPVLMVNGDVVFDVDLGRLFERHRASGARATLLLRPNPDPQRYGPVVTGRDGRIRSLVGRPRRARGTVSLFTGIHVLDPALLEGLPPGASDSVRDLYVPLVAAGEPPFGVRLRGAWYDLGDPKAYLRSQLAMLASGFGGVAPGSLVHHEARLGRDVHLERAIVGPGAIVADGARVVGSVLWGGARVGARARLRSCIVAEGAEVAADADVKQAVVVPMSRRTGQVHAGRIRGGQLWADLS
jgi:mannose-1-phosphate guanylyltransferase